MEQDTPPTAWVDQQKAWPAAPTNREILQARRDMGGAFVCPEPQENLGSINLRSNGGKRGEGGRHRCAIRRQPGL